MRTIDYSTKWKTILMFVLYHNRLLYISIIIILLFVKLKLSFWPVDNDISGKQNSKITIFEGLMEVLLNTSNKPPC